MFNPGKIAQCSVMCATIISVLLTSTPASARSYPEYVKVACKKDFKTFCPRYDIESTQLRQCMRSVADRISPKCIEALERSGERRKK